MMKKAKYEDLTTLNQGRYDWKIKVRVIRMWRGVTNSGQTFKAFNILLLDSKNNRIHAFVPTICVDELEKKISVGKICIIKNFTVQDYKPEDKFRCLRKDVMLIFSNETKIKEVDPDDKSIGNNAFDFYEHSELEELGKQNTYLADVVGIIKFRQSLSDLVNKHGNPQKQSKFTITDGKSNVKVTLWDTFALKFEKLILQVQEEPVIIIISSCRVGLWNNEVDIGNVGATEIFLNYDHYSVAHLRKLLCKPDFARQIYASDKRKTLELLKVATITSLGEEYIETEIIAHLNILFVEQKEKWFSTICTSCDNELEDEDGIWFCDRCNYVKPYPEKKFTVCVQASDETGAIQIVLGDQQVRAVLGKRVLQLIKQAGGDESFPQELNLLAKQKYTFKLKIKDVNVVNNIQIYWATNICNGFVQPNVESQNNTMQESSSSYHLDGMSQLNFRSPMSIKTKNV